MRFFTCRLFLLNVLAAFVCSSYAGVLIEQKTLMTIAQRCDSFHSAWDLDDLHEALKLVDTIDVNQSGDHVDLKARKIKAKAYFDILSSSLRAWDVNYNTSYMSLLMTASLDKAASNYGIHLPSRAGTPYRYYYLQAQLRPFVYNLKHRILTDIVPFYMNDLNGWKELEGLAKKAGMDDSFIASLKTWPRSDVTTGVADVDRQLELFRAKPSDGHLESAVELLQQDERDDREMGERGEQNLTMARAWLGLLVIVEQYVDPNLRMQDYTTYNIAPPLGAYMGIGGMDPEYIPDLQLRKDYIKAQEGIERNKDYYYTQSRLRGGLKNVQRSAVEALERIYPNVAERDKVLKEQGGMLNAYDAWLRAVEAKRKYGDHKKYPKFTLPEGEGGNQIRADRATVSSIIKLNLYTYCQIGNGPKHWTVKSELKN